MARDGGEMTLPRVPPIQGAAYGLRCPACGRAAMHLRPMFLDLYGRGQIDVTEKTIFHAGTAPYKHEVKNGEPIRCQWCGLGPLAIHTSGLGQFDEKTGFSVEVRRFMLN